MRTPSYSHTQHLWVLWLALPAAAVASGMGALAAGPAERPWMLALFAALPLGLLLFLGRLRVQLDASLLEWQFGYVGWPRWRIRLDDIVAVTVVRTTWLDGWGIKHGREGWLYNAAGFGAVRIESRDGRVIRLGSDEPERLATFIAARQPRRP